MQRIIDLLPSIVPIITILIVAAGIFIIVATQKRRKEIARDLIISYLIRNDFTMMSFERIRQNIDDTYSDTFLKGLPASFPNDLRLAKLRDPQGDLTIPGLARITKRDEPAESDIDAQKVSITVKSLQNIGQMNSLEEIRSELDQIIRKTTATGT